MDIGELLMSTGSMNNGEAETECPGIAVGVVKNNWDEDHPGMVQVEFLFGEEGKRTTSWIRVMQPYAGASYGAYFLPEVNTEVVVGFVYGNLNEGIVLGCLWNMADKPPEGIPNEKNSQKIIQTKGGHKILFDETKDKEKLEIATSKSIDILLDDKENKIAIKDQKNENSIVIDGKNGAVTISAKKKITLNVNGEEMLALDGAGKKASLKTGTIVLDGSQKMDIKGAATNIEGNTFKASAKGNLNIESNAMTQIKGSMLKLN